MGVHPAQWLRKLIDSGAIAPSGDRPPLEDDIQPASLDLRLGPVAYRLRCSFLPGDAPVEEKLAAYQMESIDITGGAVLERNRPYLVPLLEVLDLPEGVRARTNPKSSTGRVDVFTRVVTDASPTFDEIPAGYRGRLWLEVAPRSFTVKVATGLSLNQLRVLSGQPELDDGSVAALHRATPVVWDAAGGQVPVERLPLAGGLHLSVDLTGAGTGGFVAWRARKNSRLLDLTRMHDHDPADYWERLPAEPGGRLVLEPEEFYLLISAERVGVPAPVAAEMLPYEAGVGELRTHYAGFFDPGFGLHGGDRPGTPAVLEVRAHDVPFVLEHRQRICKLRFERMIERPSVLYGDDLGSHYQQQDRMLSKHFVSG